MRLAHQTAVVYQEHADMTHITPLKLLYYVAKRDNPLVITLILMMDGHLASIGTFAPRASRSVTCVTHTVAICVKVVHAVTTNHYHMIDAGERTCLWVLLVSMMICAPAECAGMVFVLRLTSL